VPGTVGAPGGLERRRPRKAPPPTLGDLEGPGAAAVAEVGEGKSDSGDGVADKAEPQPHPLDTPGFNVNRTSMVDRDEAPPASQPPPPKTAPKFRGYHDDLAGASGHEESTEDDWLKNVPPFDSSLITNSDLDD
jgi:hypothetical protein